MRREHGQAAALTVLFLTVLLASAAAVIDVGSWFREDRDTQRVADAAALAGAQALPESQGTARSLAHRVRRQERRRRCLCQRLLLDDGSCRRHDPRQRREARGQLFRQDRRDRLRPGRFDGHGSRRRARGSTVGRTDRRRREAPVARLFPDGVVLRPEQRDRARPREDRPGSVPPAEPRRLARRNRLARLSPTGFSRATRASWRSTGTAPTPARSSTRAT